MAVFGAVLTAVPAGAQRMPQDSWYLNNTVETGMFIGGAASDLEGNIYLADAKLGLIKKFSTTYQLLQTWGGLGSGDGQFGSKVVFLPESTFRNWSCSGAGGMCFTAAQELVVCDPQNHRVQIFSKSGSFVRKFGAQGTGDGQFNSPVSAACTSDGRIYVADRDNHRIQVFSNTGAFLFKFGAQGGFDGQFQKPTGVTALPDGGIAVADLGNYRIQIFSANGGYIRKIKQFAHSISSSLDGLMYSSSSWMNSVMAQDGSWNKDYCDYSLISWGNNGGGQTTVPSALRGVISIAAGGEHTVALTRDRTVTAWGRNTYGQTNVPPGLDGVVAIAAGSRHTVALKDNGRVVAWGSNGTGQTNVPAGLSGVVAIGAGIYHTVVLRNDGTVSAWGSDDYGQSTVPAGLSGVVAIAAGDYHTVALKSNGTVTAWGRNMEGQTTIPSGLSGVIAIAAGGLHTVALKSDGTVTAWGDNSGQTTVPPGLTGVVAVAAGGAHTVALKSDGTVVAWGWSGAMTPTGLGGVVAISAGGGHTVALKCDAGAVSSSLCSLKNGNVLVACESGKLIEYSRTFRNILPAAPDSIPLPVVISTTQRPGTSLVDIDFQVTDTDDATVQVAALVFRNGGTNLADVIPIKTLVEGTANKLGAGVATGQVHRITWDARADVAGDFEQLQVEILAKDARGLFNLDFIQIPSEGAQSALKISKTPLKDDDFFSAWLWLVATGDPEIILSNGTIKLPGSQYMNGLNAIYAYRWDPAWWYDMNMTNEHSDGIPMSRVDLVPVFYGYSPSSQVGSINWTGFFMPKKTGKYIFHINYNSDGWHIFDWAKVVVRDEVKLEGAFGSFTVDAQAGVAIPVSIFYYDENDWAQAFSLMIQPPDGPMTSVVPGDFVVENPVVSGAATSQTGKAFLLAKMGLREAMPAEVLRAQEAGTPGVINQWTPPLQVGPGERPVKVNAYGFETGDTGTWVVPVTH